MEGKYSFTSPEWADITGTCYLLVVNLYNSFKTFI
jgi:hypothetical protein